MIITIIVLVILAAVSINAAFNTGIIDTAVNGAVNYAEAQRQEQITFDELDGSLQDIIQRIESYDVGGGNRPTATDPKQNGSWNGTVNTPKVEGTGLTPVYYNDTTKQWVELTSASTVEEWNKWYNYDTTNKTWANARSKDGSMWVWIPRYEYKINSTAKTIDVRFISTDVKSGTAGYTTDSSTGIVKSSDDYIVHPAFMNDTANEYNNGGWSSDIPGFWVAKYAAGWQNGTQGESAKTVDYSNLTYTNFDGYTSNYVNATVTVGSTKISYPVFKANTYAYNCISVGDAYLLAKEIAGAGRYGLTGVDSHLEKNSEWGAVAYLTHSKYGLNAAEVQQNKKNLANNIDVYDTPGTKANIYAVTSYGEDADAANNTAASSTANMSGVFDLSGCVYERTATFLKGASETRYIGGMIENPNTVTSSKYVTIYEGTYDTCNKIGDAVKETSTSGSGSTSWNGDYSNFVSSGSPVFNRGGNCGNGGTNAGVFTFVNSAGHPGSGLGFRAVLVP